MILIGAVPYVINGTSKIATRDISWGRNISCKEISCSCLSMISIAQDCPPWEVSLRDLNPNREEITQTTSQLLHDILPAMSLIVGAQNDEAEKVLSRTLNVGNLVIRQWRWKLMNCNDNLHWKKQEHKYKVMLSWYQIKQHELPCDLCAQMRSRTAILNSVLQDRQKRWSIHAQRLAQSQCG